MSGQVIRPKSSKAPCQVFGKCGACDMLDIPYDAQLQRKQDILADLFVDEARESKIRPIIGMDDPFHYRNKVIAPFVPGASSRNPSKAKNSRTSNSKASRKKPNDSVITGMYAKGTHKIIESDSCLLENEVAASIIKAIVQLMKKWDIAPYDEDKGTGFLRHAVIRVGHNSDEVLVTLVTNSDKFPYSKSFCKELVKRVPQITSIVQNVNLRSTNVVLGDKFKTLYGPGFILDKLCGLSFRISPGSFYQVNSKQTEVLYETAIDLARIDDSTVVLDAYCGTGTIGLCAAKAGAKRVIGFDVVKEAISDARQNAKHNGIDNASFHACDASQFMERELPNLIKEDEKPVLLMDPPRSGADETFLASAVALAPNRIVYISCNPVTQKRDVSYLKDHGYEVEEMVGVDMFPHTEHIENIVSMVRVD